MGKRGKFKFNTKTIFNQRKNILKPLKKKIFTKRNLGITAYDITEGAVQEFADGFGKNWIDKTILGKEVSLWDNLTEQTISGGLLSTVYKTPLLFQHGINAFKSKDANQIIGENNKRIFELGKLLQQEDLSQSDFDIYQAEQIELFKENNDLIFKDIKRVDLLSDSEKNP